MIGKLTTYILVIVTQMIVWVCQTNEIYSVPYSNSVYYVRDCVRIQTRLIFGVGRFSLLYMFQKPSISQNEACKRISNNFYTI